jgi:hypothetical protein
MKSIAPHARLIFIAAMVLAISGAVPASGARAKPKGGTYKGPTPAATDSRDPTVKITVAKSRKRLSFRGPHERCGGFNPKSPFFGKIPTLTISRAGKFKGERRYQERLKGARGGDTGALDVVLDWHIKVSGRFTTPRRAKGTITWEMRQRLEDSDSPGVGWDPPGPDGPQKFGTCGERSGTWKAKHA